jgi:hypothetical protein
MLSKIPSLRLKKWNETRWLGRDACVTTLCKAYIYVLDHLQTSAADIGLKPEARATAGKLYKDLTSYEVIVFVHFYRDLISFLAIVSKQLQRQDVRISEVGRIIQTQLTRIRLYFPADLETFPPTPIGDGYGASIIDELFKDKLEGIFELRSN